MEVDIHAKTLLVHSVAPAALVADTTGAELDTVDFESVLYQIHVGVAMAGGGFDFKVQSSPDDGAGSPTGVWADVPHVDVGNGQIIGGAGSVDSIHAVIAIADANKVYRVGVISKDRHLRPVLTETGTITGGVIGVTALLSNPRTAPQADQNT